MNICGTRAIEESDDVIIFGESRAILPWVGRVGRVCDVNMGIATVRLRGGEEEKQYPAAVLISFSRVETAHLPTDRMLPLKVFQTFNERYPIVVPTASGVEVPNSLLSLIARSMSLGFREKESMIARFGELDQDQVDRLLSIFQDEGTRFAALQTSEHRYQVKVLSRQALASWVRLTFKMRGEDKPGECDPGV